MALPVANSRARESGPKDGAVKAKTVWASFRAVVREDGSVTSPETTWTFLALSDWADGEEGSRVMPRTVYSLESRGSLRTKSTIEPPC